MRMSYINPNTREVCDIIVKKRDAGGGSRVMVGDECIGILFGPSKLGDWCAVSSMHPCNGLRKVDGFHRRWMAVEYLLDVGPRSRDGIVGPI